MQRLTPTRIALLLGVALAMLRASGCQYIELLDARLGDYRLLQRGQQPAAPEVLIVAIDDASIDAVGRWPWSRAVMARLVDRLVQAEVGVIGFDVVQSEATAAHDVNLLQEQVEGVDPQTWAAVRRALSAGGGEDAALARAVRESGRTVLGYFFDLDRDGESAHALIGKYNQVKGKLAEQQEGMRQLPPRDGRVPAVVANIEVIGKAAADLGYFNFIQDGDGYIRRAPLAIRYGEDIAVPLSLAMLRLYRKGDGLQIVLDPQGVAAVRFGKLSIPVDSRGQMMVNYRGRRGTIPHIPAADVLNGTVPSEILRDKLVLVGVTATAVYDLRVTPFAPAFPGVEIHANVLDNILREDFLSRPWWSKPVEIALVALLPLLLAVPLHYARGAWGVVVTMGVIAAYVAASMWLFLAAGMVLTVLYPVLAIALTYSGITVHHYATEERLRRRTRRALELYLSPSLAALVSERPEELKLGGEKREYTVLFSDVRDFTTISEQLEPETLVELLNAYLGAMTDVIFEHNGMLDKYIGDGIMAVWGAPLPQPDHAAQACRAAFQMMRRMRELEPEWRTRGWPEITVRIGLNTGPMIFGNMGSAEHMSLTLVGDNVNLGSRLEGLNKLYGTSIIASEPTVIAAAGAAVVRELDFVRVKGRVQPVRIFELLAPSGTGDAHTKLVERSETGLRAYRERRWDDAISAFREVLTIRPNDGPARLFLERCEALRADPPLPEWDAVTNMDEK